MASCSLCEKSGFLVSIDEYGLCKSCSKNFQGLVRHHKIIPFWISMDINERNRCREAFKETRLSIPQGISLLSGSCMAVTHTSSQLLEDLGDILLSRKDYILAEKLFLESLETNKSPITAHSVYDKLIVLYSNLLRIDNDYMIKYIDFCVKDINNFVENDETMLRWFNTRGEFPYLHSFKKLSFAYEIRGQFEDAIQICQTAIKYKLLYDQSKLTGFGERLLQLEEAFDQDIVPEQSEHAPQPFNPPEKHHPPKQHSLDTITDGYQFEQYLADLLNKLGYAATTTKKSGDYGIDVLAEKSGIKYAIQCKLYSSPVGPSAVQEASTGKAYYDAHVAIVATNSTFTSSAQELAKKVGVALWDRSALIDMDTKAAIQSLSIQTTTFPPLRQEDDSLYLAAIEAVEDSEEASVAIIQRKLRIGYRRASRLLERMKMEGAVAARLFDTYSD